MTAPKSPRSPKHKASRSSPSMFAVGTATVVLMVGVSTSVGLTLKGAILRGQLTHSASVATGTNAAAGPTQTPASSPATATQTTGDTENQQKDDLKNGTTTAAAAAQTRLNRTLSTYLQGRSGAAAVMAVDTSTGVAISSGAHTSSYTASIVKLDILLTLLLQRQDDAKMPTAAEQALARRMITSSDNNAASSLWQRIGSAKGLASANRRFGLTETVPGSGGLWGLTRTTAGDQIRLLSVATGADDVLLQSGAAGKAGVLGDAQRAFAIHLLEQVVEEQAWGVSAADDVQGTALKNGWLPIRKDGYRWQVNSVGRIRTAGGSTVLIAVLTRGSSNLTYGITTVEKVSLITMAALEDA